MLFLVKLYPEITVKSRAVRWRLIRQLRRNLKGVLREQDPDATVTAAWDSLEVAAAGDDPERRERLWGRLARVPGVGQILMAERFSLPSLDGMAELALARFGERLAGRTFAVRCKRSGRHGFRSMDVERHVGAVLCRETGADGVDLGDPDVLIAMEIRDDRFYLVTRRRPGLGGFPLGSQGAVLSLISGGFDSAVSSYLCMRRGLRTHFCFFSLGGREHELAVREVALFLWMKYHSSHPVRFVSVPFEAVAEQILARVDGPLTGVVLKRMMLRAAQRVARELEVKALATGESVAQVSSQTLDNLAVIDAASETLVLRPLIAAGKQEIIDTARDIGTEAFSRSIPEYCAAVSIGPTTRARPDRVRREEARFDFGVLDRALADADSRLITDAGPGDAPEDVPVVRAAPPGSTVIDIRHPDERASRRLPKALAEEADRVLEVPFYELAGKLGDLNLSGRCLLYCDRGMLSRLHAARLRDLGLAGAGVIEPEARRPARGGAARDARALRPT